MTKTTIFIAAPISGFEDQNEYIHYRQNVLELILLLRNMHYEVYSELEKVISDSEYESPEDAVKEDFFRIQRMDVFILLHPKRMQTSSLVELGFACAHAKKIIIVSPYEAVPFLVRGLHAFHGSVQYIDTKLIDEEVIQKIQRQIDM